MEILGRNEERPLINAENWYATTVRINCVCIQTMYIWKYSDSRGPCFRRNSNFCCLNFLLQIEDIINQRSIQFLTAKSSHTWTKKRKHVSRYCLFLAQQAGWDQLLFRLASCLVQLLLLQPGTHAFPMKEKPFQVIGQ